MDVKNFERRLYTVTKILASQAAVSLWKQETMDDIVDRIEELHARLQCYKGVKSVLVSFVELCEKCPLPDDLVEARDAILKSLAEREELMSGLLDYLEGRTHVNDPKNHPFLEVMSDLSEATSIFKRRTRQS